MGDGFVMQWVQFTLEGGGQAVVVEKKAFEELLRRGGVAFDSVLPPQPTLEAALGVLAKDAVTH